MGSFTSEDDSLVLEDESGRVSVSGPGIRCHSLVSGAFFVKVGSQGVSEIQKNDTSCAKNLLCQLNKKREKRASTTPLHDEHATVRLLWHAFVYFGKGFWKSVVCLTTTACAISPMPPPPPPPAFQGWSLPLREP